MKDIKYTKMKYMIVAINCNNEMIIYMNNKLK